MHYSSLVHFALGAVDPQANKNTSATSATAGSAAAWPLVAHAQQRVLPAIGFLSPGSLESDLRRLSGVRQGLKEVGYIDGQDVTIEYRGAGGQIDRLPVLAADLVRREVAVIIAVAATATNAAKGATTELFSRILCIARARPQPVPTSDPDPTRCRHPLFAATRP